MWSYGDTFNVVQHCRCGEDEASGRLRTVWFLSCRTPLGCARRFAVKSRFLGPEGARNDKGGDAAERLGAMRGEIFHLQAAWGSNSYDVGVEHNGKLVQSHAVSMACTCSVEVLVL